MAHLYREEIEARHDCTVVQPRDAEQLLHIPESRSNTLIKYDVELDMALIQTAGGEEAVYNVSRDEDYAFVVYHA
jgi:hypothetical protein